MIRRAHIYVLHALFVSLAAPAFLLAAPPQEICSGETNPIFLKECAAYAQREAEINDAFSRGAYDTSKAYQPSTPQNRPEYFALAPIPGVPRTTTDLSAYLQGMFRLLVVAAGILAVVMIVVGGFQYISTEALGGKEEGRKKITNAVVGLLLLFLAVPLLTLLNPQLLRFKLGLVEINLVPAIVPKFTDTKQLVEAADSAVKKQEYCDGLLRNNFPLYQQECGNTIQQRSVDTAGAVDTANTAQFRDFVASCSGGGYSSTALGSPNSPAYSSLSPAEKARYDSVKIQLRGRSNSIYKFVCPNGTTYIGTR